MHETLELVLRLLELSRRVEEIEVVLENLIHRSKMKTQLRKFQRSTKQREQNRKQKPLNVHHDCLRKCDEDEFVEKTLEAPS